MAAQIVSCSLIAVVAIRLLPVLKPGAQEGVYKSLIQQKSMYRIREGATPSCLFFDLRSPWVAVEVSSQQLEFIRLRGCGNPPVQQICAFDPGIFADVIKMRVDVKHGHTRRNFSKSNPRCYPDAGRRPGVRVALRRVTDPEPTFGKGLEPLATPEDRVEEVGGFIRVRALKAVVSAQSFA